MIKATIQNSPYCTEMTFPCTETEMLKKIGELARKDIEQFMGDKVYLQTWVKVKENWRDNQAQLQNFGYTE